MAVTGLFAGSASAVLTRNPEPFSPLTGAASGVTLNPNGLFGVAVDESTGNVFVNDGPRPGAGVVILGEEGAAPVGLAAPYVVPGTSEFFEGNAPSFVAFDNSASSPAKGTLYVYDQSSEIHKYVRNSSTEQYEELAGQGIPLAGCGRFSQGGGGLDADGDIYFACYEKDEIDVFSPSGALLKRVDLAGTALQGAVSSGIAVDAAGDIFFVQYPGGSVYEIPVNGIGEYEPEGISRAISAAEARGIAYEPAANELLVSHANELGRGGSEVTEYDASSFERLGAYGFERSAGASEFSGLAINLKSERVYAVNSSALQVWVFGPDVIVPTLSAFAPTNVTGSKATLNGAVNPEGVAIIGCQFEYGETEEYEASVPCEQPVPGDSEPHPVSATISGLKQNGTLYHYRLVAENGNGSEESTDRTFVTGTTIATEPATGIDIEAATLHGVVSPEGSPYTECVFEWGLATGAVYEHTTPCNPPATSIEPNFAAHPVSASLTGLEGNSTYKFRLAATNNSTPRTGEVLTFTTPGPPQISTVRARNATQTSVSLEAAIDPSGFTTSYRFEWGAGEGYGHEIPAEFEPTIGNGREPIRVTAKVSGLAAATVYHYRVVATNTARGATTTASSDHWLETLNSCGLPDGRCLEMVSPNQPGSLALPGEATSALEINFQASRDPGSINYESEPGLPANNHGSEVIYTASRGSSGWSAAQTSPDIIEPNQNGASAIPSFIEGFAPDLSCGLIKSNQQLTAQPAAKLTTEAGGVNLYRRNSDGSYTLITSLVPEVLGANDFVPVGMSKDCSRIFFTTSAHYPGVSAVSGSVLYEWNEGDLQAVDTAPGISGEEEVKAKPAAFNAVSQDGGVVFFTGERLVGGNPAEVGTEAVFARIDGDYTVDVSLSQTATPDEGATYQGASADGSRVYFVANAGLTAESSTEGTDLYEYDLVTEELTDITVSHEPGGAQAGGVFNSSTRIALVGAADDGSRVYFIAEGRLQPGHGPTLAENKAAGTISLYDYAPASGNAHFIAAIDGNQYKLEPLVILGAGTHTTSRVSPDGRYLLFQSATNLTNYVSGGGNEAYLYDAAGGEDRLTCVSCRQDGQHTVFAGSEHLVRFSSAARPKLQAFPLSLVERDGEPLVFFASRDKLAEGGVEGEENIYEWAHSQVFAISTEGPAGTSAAQTTLDPLRFVGASADGTDLYFTNSAALNWEDPEALRAVWDARVGGGFAPDPAPVVCQATQEGSCQGAATPEPATPAANSSTFTGPGNVKAKPSKTKKHKKKQKGKKHKKAAKHRKTRNANTNRRAGK
jgi:hypothetical protein